MAKKAKKNRKTDQVPDVSIRIPLEGDVWTGADNKQWQDIAVDSTSQTGIFWLRRRIDDNCYFLIVGTRWGHVLKKELTVQEAKKFHKALPDHVPFSVAFDCDDDDK